MRQLWRWGLIIGLLAAGCGPAPTLAPPTPARLTQAATLTAPAPNASATPASRELVLWVPPEFAPVAEQPGGVVLAAQLDNYAQLHPGWRVRARAKAVTGAGGLLESLLNAYHAAPAALPDLVALSRGDLEAAAAADLVLPLDTWVSAAVFEAYYPFAQTLGRVNGQWVSLPFAIDARWLAYAPAAYPVPPARWAEVVTGTLIFPGAEPFALSLLADYLAGGALTGADGRLALDAGRLAAILTAWQELAAAGVLPLSTLAYDTPAATWQIFRERRASLALTSASWYLREAARVAGTSAALPPTTTGAPFTLVEGWGWALVNKAGDLAPAAELLTWLVEPKRQAAWTQAAFRLPAQPAALAAWDDTPFIPLAAETLTRAQAQPDERVLEKVGPLLRRALDDVLNDRATPAVAAAAAAQALANSQP
ncbi:MAG: extracellular solute-binding protein [Anaerolineales bacterium]|nr:extracellular solute-binding protein [Anaerolineales bacterium]